MDWGWGLGDTEINYRSFRFGFGQGEWAMANGAVVDGRAMRMMSVVQMQRLNADAQRDDDDVGDVGDRQTSHGRHADNDDELEAVGDPKRPRDQSRDPAKLQWNCVTGLLWSTRAKNETEKSTW